MKRSSRLHSILLSSIIAILFVAQSAPSVSIHSITADEGYHLTTGAMVVKTKDFRLNIDHPYLGHILLALPTLAISNMQTAELDSRGWQESDSDQIVKRIISLNGGPYRFTLQILSIARLTVLIAATLFLYCFFYFIKREFDTITAFFSTTLLSLSPTFIAHSTIATNDIFITIFIFATTATLFLYIKTPQGIKKTALFLLFIILGWLSLITKQSSLVVAIAWAMILALHDTKKIFNNIVRTICVILAWVCLIWISYGFDFSYYRAGIETIIIGKYQTRHESYFFGIYEHLGWYYHLMAWLIKEPLSFVILTITGIVFSLKKIKHYSKYAPFIVTPLLFGIIASAGHTKIGIRHVLPLYPFLALYGGYGASQIIRKWRKMGVYITSTSIAYLALSVISSFPHHLTYFNELLGGSTNGYKYLQDSNLDWGQNEMVVQDFIASHEELEILYEPERVVLNHYYIIRLTHVFGKKKDQSNADKEFEFLHNKNQLQLIENIANTHWLVYAKSKGE